MWSVRVLSGQQSGQIFDLKLGKNVFGRGGVSDFKVQSLGISKEHCEVHVYKDKMMIVDLKSSNGTFVNGVKIQNSLVRVGDKISLFDIIMDLIPTPDLRPKNNSKSVQNALVPTEPKVQRVSPPAAPWPQQMAPQTQSYPQNGNLAYQMNTQTFNPTNLQAVPQETPKAQPSFSEKVETFIENDLMPAIYKLGIIFSFKQVLMSFIIIFIFGVTLLSMFPLVTIIKESNMIEATKRARSVARAMAKVNEQALLSGQLTNLTVSEALKEEGIKEAFIIQHSDGAIVAPSEKAGRETTNSFILQARKESRATVGTPGVGLLGASHPIGVYDPSTGEPTVKYHAIVIYDVSSLSLDQERMLSLFMQTLCMASILGLMLYFLFARFIDYPIRSLNEQIDKALIEKSDRTEIAFDYPAFQKLVSNVNTLLNRVWSGDGNQSNSGPQQNKDIELSNLVEIISHPAMVVDANNRVVALNSNFEQLAQTTKDVLINQSYQCLNDTALVQNIEALMIRSKQSPYEKHADKIPFSQFECHIYCQAFLNSVSEPEFFIFTLLQAEVS
jgi:pSer/pThr/pTyr-binding forkhead associated (FHA) protein